MPLGMLLSSIPGGIVERRSRRGSAERTVIADIGPDVAGDRLALGQDRHSGVVAVQPFAGQNMGLDEGVERGKRRRAGADPRLRGDRLWSAMGRNSVCRSQSIARNPSFS